MRKLGLILGLGCVLAVTAAAQVNPPVAPNVPPPLQQLPSVYGGKWEVYLGGMMQFAASTSANGNTVNTSNVPGGQAALRLHLSDFQSVELRYGLAQPVQYYQDLTIKSNEQEFGFDYAWTYPATGFFRPYFLGGLSMLRYGPIPSQSTPGATHSWRPALVYGGGVDAKINNRWSVRVEYRGLFYRLPDFNLITYTKWNHMPVPAVGIVYHF